MNESGRRPRAVTVVGYATFAIGVFVLCVSLVSPFMDDRPQHTFADTAAGCALGLFVIVTGRALLRLRKWASLVIEIVAALFLLFSGVFGAFVIWIGIASVRSGGLHAARMLTPGIALAVVYAVTSFLTMRSLRKVRLRGLLV